MDLPPVPWFVSPDPHGGDPPSLVVWRLADGAGYRFLYRPGAEFLLDGAGHRVRATWPASMSPEKAAAYLLGPILGFVLRLRGVVCLHASAVAVAGGAIALVGPAGAGKSMAAGAFGKLGRALLSDDKVALVDGGTQFQVQPGCPRLRLWPPAVAALFGSADALPRIAPHDPAWDKRYLDLHEGEGKFQPSPLPLVAIYFLVKRGAGSAAPAVEVTACQPGLVTLLANTHLNYLSDRQMRLRDFEVLSRVVQHVPLRTATPHVDPARLPALCQAILTDLHALPREMPAPRDT